MTKSGIVYSFGINTYKDFDVHKIKNGGGDTFNMKPKIIDVLSKCFYNEIYNSKK